MWVKHLQADSDRSGGVGRLQGVRGQGIELRVKVGAHQGALKIFEHRSHLNIASTLKFKVSKFFQPTFDRSPWPASPDGENE